jgi:hypothetical protein
VVFAPLLILAIARNLEVESENRERAACELREPN